MNAYNLEQIAQSQVRIRRMRSLRKTMSVRQIARKYRISTQRVYQLFGRK